MKRRLIIITTVVALVALIAFRLAANKEKIDEQNVVVDRSKIAIPVTVMRIESSQPTQTFSLPSEVEANKTVGLTLNGSGILKDVKFELGSYVRKGQYLGGIDITRMKLEYDATELLVNKLERDYNNFKALYEQKAASENDYVNAKYNYENAKAKLAQIAQQMSDATVQAPISGIVVAKNVEAGEFVSMGRSLGTVVDVQSLKTEVMVGESEVYKIKEGMEVSIATDVYPQHTFTGKVRFVSPKGDQNHNYKVEVVWDNSKDFPLKAGTFVRVQFDVSQHESRLMMPKIALVEGLRNPFVYVVENNEAHVRQVKTGEEFGENIEILSGLSAGEQVVLSGQINLQDNSLVEVISK
ncbi:efflux RND transporter periplasmic adaptor subunit [bacterium]|nr:efflux RND transporter periplasmic adaptor subunit [bacterium]